MVKSALTAVSLVIGIYSTALALDEEERALIDRYSECSIPYVHIFRHAGLADIDAVTAASVTCQEEASALLRYYLQNGMTFEEATAQKQRVRELFILAIMQGIHSGDFGN